MKQIDWEIETWRGYGSDLPPGMGTHEEMDAIEVTPKVSADSPVKSIKHFNTFLPQIIEAPAFSGVK